jgi:fructose-1,6-bisphosphatase I
MSSLQHHLETWAEGDALRVEAAAAIGAIATAAAELAARIARGALGGDLAARVCGTGGGDVQLRLDLEANRLFLDALGRTTVRLVASEESAEPVTLRGVGRIGVVLDPLDGSTNVETNLSIGSLFGIRALSSETSEPFKADGSGLLAAGFVVYGPRTELVLTLRRGTQIFTLDPASRAFILTRPQVEIPPSCREYAINGSNARHWDPPVRAYVAACQAGADGPRGLDFNTRWIASLVAEAYRILVRGGVFLYPRDARPGYERGRLRLTYEAHPLALVVEQAGGAATDGSRPILELVPDTLHARTPLVFGSREEVARIAELHAAAGWGSESPPLFGRRGLFRT